MYVRHLISCLDLSALGPYPADLFLSWRQWVGDELKPSEIAYGKYDLIYYAFGVPTKAGKVNMDSGSNALLQQLVHAAHQNNSKVILSVGGWSDSKYFSSLVASKSSRANFASNLQSLHKEVGVDGFDIDWEYPNDAGAGSNEKSPQDLAHLETFLTLLRKRMPDAILSTTSTQSPWNGPNGNPAKDVSKAAAALDFVFVMNYDVWGSTSKPGPNAPLADICGDSSQPEASAAASIAAWTGAGLPREKILMGMPMYGYVSKSSATRLQERRSGENDTGTRSSSPNATDSYHSHRRPSQEQIQAQQSLLQPGQGSTFKQSSLSTGQNNFNVFVAQSYLQKDHSGNFKAQSGWTLNRDHCSDTPFMYNHQQVITYDDPLSIYEKSVFSALAGIGGVGFWSIDGDTKDHDLVNAAIKGITLQPF